MYYIHYNVGFDFCFETIALKAFTVYWQKTLFGGNIIEIFQIIEIFRL